MNKEIDDKLKEKNIKPTAMRELVFKTMLEQKTAVSLPELERKIASADKATLFRTLKTFREHQLIHAIEDGSGSLRYAVCEDECQCEPEHLHIHFLCNKCGKTRCLTELPVPVPELPEGFVFESANFVVKGLCPDCRG